MNGINNPCPAGYGLPTEVEGNAERLSLSSNNCAGAFDSPVKLPVATRRGLSNGSLLNVSANGSYWSSTLDGTYSRHLYFGNSAANMNISNRAHGLSIRFIMD